MRSNKVEYSTAAGVYCTTYDVKVTFYMLEFSSSKISNHWFHVNNDNGYSGIGYDMIIGCDMMVQIGLTSYFKRQILQWDSATLHMKEPSVLIGKYDLNKWEMREVVMHTADPFSTIEATERLVKILKITYVKADFYQVADNANQINSEERTL